MTNGWHQFTQWADDRDIAIPGDTTPAPFVVAAFLLERLHNTWRPHYRPTGKPIRVKHAEKLLGGIARHCRDQGWEATILSGPTPVRDVIGSAKAKLPARQVQRRRARPLTDMPDPNNERGEIGALVDGLASLAETNHVSPLWIARERALILTGYAAGMRIGAMLLLDQASIRFVQPKDGPLVLWIEDWHGKGRTGPDPDIYTAWCCCEIDPSLCAVHAVAAWLAIVDEHQPDIRRVFPTVYKLNPFLPVPEPQSLDTAEAGRLRDLDQLDTTWRVCDSHNDEQAPDLELGASDEVCVVCSLCLIHSTAPVRSVVRNRFPCTGCRDRYTAHRAGNLLPTDPEGQVSEIVDDFADHRRGNPPDPQRITRATARENKSLKWLASIAGIETRPSETLSSHGLRGGTMTKQAANGFSDLAIAQVANHRSVSTTARYIENRLLIDDHPMTSVPGFGQPDADEDLSRAAEYLRDQ